MKKIIFTAALVALSNITTVPSAYAEWSGWRLLGSQQNVDLWWRSNERKDGGTDVQFRAANGNDRKAYVTILNKVFSCKDGSKETRSDEAFGNIDAGDAKGLVADAGLCQFRGGVDQVNVDLQVE